MLALIALLAATCAAAEPLAVLRGTDFAGGANRHYGTTIHGKDEVNYVYARPTGAESTMQAAFALETVPDEPQFVYLLGLDDDGPDACAIEVRVNDAVVYAGDDAFGYPAWRVVRWPVPPDTLRAGGNRIVITNTEPAGPLGNVPWFCLALGAVAPAGYELRLPRPALSEAFRVSLPAEPRPFPEPLAPEHPEPGFAIRMVKGWHWTGRQYLDVLPAMQTAKFSHLMYCYTSLFPDFPAWRNEWWKPLPDERWAEIEQVLAEGRARGIELVFAMHPQFASPRPLEPTSDEDFAAFSAHFVAAQQRGVRWFAVPFDDVAASTAQFAFVNRLFALLRATDPAAQLIFCPTWYWGDGATGEARAYNDLLAAELQPEVYLFWTGDAVVTPSITRQALETYRSIVRHRVIIWDNYPVNDAQATLHLGPVIGRDTGLCELADGYLTNSMCRESEIGVLPMLTCGDYAWNPWGYDPLRSIGQAIHQTGRTPVERELLAELVEAYPGMIYFGAGTGFNPVRENWRRLRELPHSGYLARAYLERLERLSARCAEVFGERFAAAQARLADDPAWLRERVAERFGE